MYNRVVFLLYWIFNGFFVISFWLDLIGFLLLILLKLWVGLLVIFFWLVLLGFIFMLKLEFLEWIKLLWLVGFVIEFEFEFKGGICMEMLWLVFSLWDLLWLLLVLSFFCSVLSLLVCDKLVVVFLSGGIVLVELFVVIFVFLRWKKL